MKDFSAVNFAPGQGRPTATEQASDQQELHDAALRLIEYNWEADPGINASFLFPSSNEIRLIHLDENSLETRMDDGIMPFYFGSSAADDIPFPSAIALIRPEEKERLSPPEGWGGWEQAEQFSRKAA